MQIIVTDAWYWGGRQRIAFIADGKMFNCAAASAWGVYLIESGIVRDEAEPTLGAS